MERFLNIYDKIVNPFGFIVIAKGKVHGLCKPGFPGYDRVGAKRLKREIEETDHVEASISPVTPGQIIRGC